MEERTTKQRNPQRSLAVRVTLLAVTVGAVVAAVAAVAGAGGCAAPSSIVPSGPADVVCFHLVRTLAERVGIATALVTAILTLTVVGLSRLVGEQASTQAPDRPR